MSFFLLQKNITSKRPLSFYLQWLDDGSGFVRLRWRDGKTDVVWDRVRLIDAVDYRVSEMIQGDDHTDTLFDQFAWAFSLYFCFCFSWSKRFNHVFLFLMMFVDFLFLIIFFFVNGTEVKL